MTASIPVGSVPFGVAVNPKTNTIYAANELAGTVSVISGQTNTVTATIHVGSVPRGVAVDTKAKATYVANLDSNTVSVLAACPK